MLNRYQFTITRPLGITSLGMIIVTWLLVPVSSAVAQSVTVNEIMSSNTTTITDEDGDYSDWIEIFNSSQETASLRGHGLSDDPEDPYKWVFPDISIASCEFMLVFASGKDRADVDGELHTCFRLRSLGESLVFTAPNERTIDLLNDLEIETDVSFGRFPDGGDEWAYFYEPSPGASNGDEEPPQRVPEPQFDLRSGFYQPGTRLTISCVDTSASIRYTLDGSIPDETSILYSTPLLLDSVTVVRSISIREGLFPSRIVSNTYFVDYETNMPVVSIITDPPNLWDWETGVYVMGPNAEEEYPFWGANFWQDWEIPVHVDFFEPDQNLGFSLNAGVKIHGGWSRAQAQKSLRITTRNDYGYDKIEYQLFPDLPIFSFKSILLRNSGNDWDLSMFRDAFMTGLMSQTGVAHQSYRPAVVFLNGAYWGIHNLRERLDEYYLEDHFGIDRNRVDLIERYRIINAGDIDAYLALTDFLENHDIREQSNYDTIQTMLDTDNFIRYQAAEIYFCNLDWPGNNVRCWRPKHEGGFFQWLLYDTDLSFGSYLNYDFNTLAIATEPDGPLRPNPPHSTFLFRRLLENESFRTNFIVRSCDLMNIQFRTDRVIELIEQISDGIANEMPVHEERWYPDHDWEWHLNIMMEFARHRRRYMIQHIREEFNLDSTIELTIEKIDASGGRVRVNPFFIDNFPWHGEYFSGLPISISAEPFAGYRFAGWEGDIDSNSLSLEIVPRDDMTIGARFERVNSPDGTVVITEINYNSSEEFVPGDWVELFCLSGDHHLEGWLLRDVNDNREFVIPFGTHLSEGDFLILAEDRDAFVNLFPEVNNVLGDLGFAFDGNGDQVRLFNPDELLIDSVAFDDEHPWPFQPDGHGPTLQLLDPEYANQFAHNWNVSRSRHGDPGEMNGLYEIKGDNSSTCPDKYTIFSVYPNPSNNRFTIEFALENESNILMEIFDLGGRKIETLISGHYLTGNHLTTWNAHVLPSGIYIVRLRSRTESQFMKAVLMK
ncbi:CotH kinase family protein [bacterium]|nr:CotH kinase family protein [bacterium]